MVGKRHELWIFIAIIAIAAFFRFYRLDTLPPGLWPDEAANGVDALKTLEGCRNIEISKCLKEFKIFYPDNNGREGLFINLQAVSISLLGATPFALRIVSAIIGTLTIAGLYLLTRRLFTWQIAAAASLFMAISFWHVNFSRIGFRAIMLPFILVWGFYFLWRGLQGGKLREFFIAGLIGGAGLYTYFSFRIAPLVVLVVFWNYWSYLKKDFDHAKYEHTKNQLLRGFALVMLTVIAIGLPLGVYFYTHPEDFLKREGRPISVFAQENPVKELGSSIVKTLAMFNFSGDYNQRHNIPGWPQLSIPIGLMFTVGFLRELAHWLRRKHGHFSTNHTLLFSWFFIMLLPGFLSTEAPHALRAIGVIPVVMIFAAQGFWWFVNLILYYHRHFDPHAQIDKIAYARESRLLAGITILVFLASLGFLEYSRYFKTWAGEHSLNDAFAQKLVNISYYLKNTNRDIPKFVLVNEGDVLVDGVPNNAQTIRFLTITHSYDCSIKNNIYYLRSDQVNSMRFPHEFVFIPLSDNLEIKRAFRDEFGVDHKKEDQFTVYYR